MTKKSGTEIALDTFDKTPYGSRVSTHSGKPIGALYKDMWGSALQRTQNWDQGGSRQVGYGYTQWITRSVNQYWKLQKPYIYMYKGMNDPVSDKNMEMFMYVDCPSLQSMDRIDEKVSIQIPRL